MPHPSKKRRKRSRPARPPAPKASPRKRTSLPIAPRFTPEQRFSCRDCPARCCRLPLQVRLIGEDSARLLGDAWVRERVGAAGLAVMQRGYLPIREHQRHTQCVFLDDDELCSLQKRHGHSFLPAACRAFPFSFVRDEHDTLLASLSRLCPSVRDSYGEPARPQLAAKLKQLGVADRVSDGITSWGGTRLAPSQLIEVAGRWRDRLAEGDAPIAQLARVLDWTLAFEEALPAGERRVRDSALSRALDEADAIEAIALRPVKKAGLYGRLLLAILFGHIGYPARVRSENRIEPVRGSRLLGLRILLARIGWLLGWGKADMLLIDAPVPLARARALAPPVSGELGTEIARYLCMALDRRRLLAQPRPLRQVLLDLVLAAIVASRFARFRAAARGDEPELADVREGIGIAELLIVAHATPGTESALVQYLRHTLIAQPATLRRLLAAETR